MAYLSWTVDLRTAKAGGKSLLNQRSSRHAGRLPNTHEF